MAKDVKNKKQLYSNKFNITVILYLHIIHVIVLKGYYEANTKVPTLISVNIPQEGILKRVTEKDYEKLLSIKERSNTNLDSSQDQEAILLVDMAS